MDCRMRLWLARRYHPRTVARCYQQGPTRCYQPTPRTGTMSLQIFLNSLTLSPLSGVRGVCSLNSTFVGMKRTAVTSLYIGLTLLCWLAKWWIQTQYQTAQCKYTSCPSKTFMVWCLYVVLKSIFGHIFLSINVCIVCIVLNCVQAVSPWKLAPPGFSYLDPLVKEGSVHHKVVSRRLITFKVIRNLFWTLELPNLFVKVAPCICQSCQRMSQ